MTIRWVMIGDDEEPVAVLRFDSTAREWWNLELHDEHDEDHHEYWFVFERIEERPATRAGWKPGWVSAGYSDVRIGDAVLFYGDRTKPDTYKGSRPGVDEREVTTKEVLSALRFWGLPSTLVDEPPTMAGARGEQRGRQH